MPTFGPALRSEWLLDPEITYLNHGTVGATPRRVLAHQRAITDEIERQPARFMLRELADTRGTATTPPRLRVAAAAVAEFVGVRGRGPAVRRQHHGRGQRRAAFVPVRLRRRDRGDQPRLRRRGQHGDLRRPAPLVARVRTIELPQPGAARGDYVEAIANGLGPRTRLLIVDHLTPGTALVLPLAEIAGAVPRAWRAGVRRRGTRARQHRRRHRRPGGRLVCRQPAQVGVGAAQCRPAVGGPAAPRLPAPDGDLVGPRQRRSPPSSICSALATRRRS